MVAFAAALVLLSVSPSSVRAWGEEGHRYINRAAAQKLPPDMPAFFRAAAERLTFLGPEPDRWRDQRELYSALRESTAPDHFIDIDRPEAFEALPDDRYKYARWLLAQGKDPKEVGFLPYAILEGYQKVQVLFRMWRDPQYAAERAEIEQNIIYYAGVLGHYVADGAQPLHTTIHYNGWSTSLNPSYFTREPLHWRFESEYVRAQIKPEDFSQMVNPARRLQDPFHDIVKYLLETHSRVKQLYQMEKVARWDASKADAQAKRFVAERLAAGAQMLADLWYTAWLGSEMRPPR
jgi:hypothetical protein